MIDHRGPGDMELLFPEREFDYNGLTVVVRALPSRRVLKILETFLSMSRYEDRSAQEATTAGSTLVAQVMAQCWQDILRLLDQSVEVRGISEQRGVLDLPFRMFPDLLQAFMEVNFEVGKWLALGRAMGLGPLGKRLIESVTSIATAQRAADS